MVSKVHFNMERYATFPLDEILPQILDNLPYYQRKQAEKSASFEHDGHVVRLSSLRLRTFKQHGVVCFGCGVEGSFFAMERHGDQSTYHLNLYGIDKDGDEVLFTKDHIIPRSKGGRDVLWNMRTLCKMCNKIRGNGDLIVKRGLGNVG